MYGKLTFGLTSLGTAMDIRMWNVCVCVYFPMHRECVSGATALAQEMYCTLASTKSVLSTLFIWRSCSIQATPDFLCFVVLARFMCVCTGPGGGAGWVGKNNTVCLFKWVAVGQASPFFPKNPSVAPPPPPFTTHWYPVLAFHRHPPPNNSNDQENGTFFFFGAGVGLCAQIQSRNLFIRILWRVCTHTKH